MVWLLRRRRTSAVPSSRGDSSDYLAARRAALLGILQRAVNRGEFPSDLDLEFTFDLVLGASCYRRFVAGKP